MLKEVIEEAKYIKKMVTTHWVEGTIAFGLLMCLYGIAGFVVL